MAARKSLQQHADDVAAAVRVLRVVLEATRAQLPVGRPAVVVAGMLDITADLETELRDLNEVIL
jgi:hypothetical protein